MTSHRPSSDITASFYQGSGNAWRYRGGLPFAGTSAAPINAAFLSMYLAFLRSYRISQTPPLSGLNATLPLKTLLPTLGSYILEIYHLKGHIMYVSCTTPEDNEGSATPFGSCFDWFVILRGIFTRCATSLVASELGSRTRLTTFTLRGRWHMFLVGERLHEL